MCLSKHLYTISILLLLFCVLKHKAVALMPRFGYFTVLNRLNYLAPLIFDMGAGREAALAQMRHKLPESERDIFGVDIFTVFGNDGGKARCIESYDHL